MTKTVKAIPDEYRAATPYLCIKEAAGALDFYKQAFGATEIMRLTQPDGRIGHAEIKIGDAPIMMADEFPEMGFRGPQSLGGTPVTIHLYVEDVDALTQRRRSPPARRWRAPVKDEFYGDRAGRLIDPSATAGCSPPTRRTSRSRRCSGEPRPCSAQPMERRRSDGRRRSSSPRDSTPRRRT